MGIKSKTLNKEISTVQKTISAGSIVRKVEKARFLLCLGDVPSVAANFRKTFFAEKIILAIIIGFCFLEESMKNIFLAFLVLVFPVIFVSCVQNGENQYEVDDFQNDSESYYREYEDDDFIPDEDAADKIWDVSFQFLGTINDGNAEEISYGSGNLIYRNKLNESITINSSMWVIRKELTLNSGYKIPIFQIFFADDPSHVDENGMVTYFVLQLEGSSVAKSETYYLNHDKLYRTKVKLDEETGKVREICYLEEPDSSQGGVTFYTHNVRIGEEFRVDGYATMVEMEVKECKMMN